MIEPAYVKFDVAGGKIGKVEMWPVSPLADFTFDYRDPADGKSDACGDYQDASLPRRGRATS